MNSNIIIDKERFVAKDNYIQIKKPRSSNFELYRIICMLMIMAHHYVVLSGINIPMTADKLAPNSLYLYLFGMWGKTGINCFLMITGYFMCTRTISVNKFLKLYLWVMIYTIALTVIFLFIGKETLSPMLLLRLLPFTNIHSDCFPSAFMAWWLFIPFLNIVINNIGKRQHQLLISLTVLIFTIYSFVPKILFVAVNPICWFSTIYFVASYIRKYPESIFKWNSATFWGYVTVFMIICSMFSVLTFIWIDNYIGVSIPQYYMVSDSNQPLAFLVSVSSFLWFKNLRINYNQFINILGGASFGVLLIHSGSRAMIDWLWKDIVDCVGHYNLPLWQLIGYSFGVILIIYLVCTIIDYIRLKIIEEPFFRWYEKKPRFHRLSLFLSK